jgi:hypothetical protein
MMTEGLTRNGVQRRMDRLVRDRHELRRENQELRHSNQELRAALERALAVIDKLRGRKCQMHSK